MYLKIVPSIYHQQNMSIEMWRSTVAIPGLLYIDGVLKLKTGREARWKYLPRPLSVQNNRDHATKYGTPQIMASNPRSRAEKIAANFAPLNYSAEYFSHC